jgi:hypothetical protein
MADFRHSLSNTLKFFVSIPRQDQAWYIELVQSIGEICVNIGVAESEEGGSVV